MAHGKSLTQRAVVGEPVYGVKLGEHELHPHGKGVRVYRRNGKQLVREIDESVLKGIMDKLTEEVA